MLVSHRATRSPSTGGLLSTRALLHPDYRVHLVENHGVVCDDGLALRRFARVGHVGRPCVTWLVEGTARLRFDGEEAWMEPGDVALFPAKGGLEMRQESRPRYRALVLEWDPGHVFATRPARFEVRSFAPSEATWERVALLASSDARAAAEQLRDALTPATELAPSGMTDDDEASDHHALAHALDVALSDLASHPGATDLESALGRSVRQVQRDVHAFNTRYGFNAGSWRDARNRRRLLAAAAFLSRRDAEAQIVAREVGYRSHTALCRAFSDAGFPPPASVAAHLANNGL